MLDEQVPVRKRFCSTGVDEIQHLLAVPSATRDTRSHGDFLSKLKPNR